VTAPSLAAAPVALLRATAVTKTFGSGALAVPVLHGVTVELLAGELALLMGPSGSGKTTLLSILAGLLRPTGGAVELCGASLVGLSEAAVARVRRRHLGFVFQAYNLFPALSALDNVAEVLAMKGEPIAAARAEAALALARVGLADRVRHLPRDLSGGQKQRVAIARALAGKPSLLLGDEVTAALDGTTATSVMEILRAHVGPRTGVLLVTHDRRLERFADRVIAIEDGRVVRDERTGVAARSVA
jgi:putative ABC transport system ATP-binding protein